jgi:hypothetical protein
LKFDHIPQINQSSSAGYLDSQASYTTDISNIDLKPKTLLNYRKDFFIINALRQQLSNYQGHYQGQVRAYKDVLNQMKTLVQLVENKKEQEANNQKKLNFKH